MSKVEWKKVRLGDICEIITGNTPKTSDVENYNSHDIPFYKPSDISENEVSLLLESENYVSYFSKKSIRLLPADSILVTCIGTIGKIGLTKTRCCSNQQINALVPKNGISTKFLAYSLFNKKEVLKQIANAPVVPIINKTQFSNFQVTIPVLIDHQRHIAAILDKANEMIALRKKQLSELDALAESVFYDLFGDPVKNEKGWVSFLLNDICINIVDCPHSTPVKSSVPTEYPCIRTSELKNGEINWASMQYVDKNEYKSRIMRLVPQPNDIVYGREGTYGDAVCLPSGYYFCLGQRTMLFRPNIDKVNSKYLLYIILSDYVYNQAKRKNSGSTVGHVNVADIKRFDIPLPPLPLQTRFAAIIEKIEEQKVQVRTALQESEDLFQKLMQDLFRPD